MNLIRLGILAVAAALLMGCGRADDGNTRDKGTIGQAGGVQPSTPVTVDLTEMKVAPSRGEVAPGLITFAAKNSGSIPHELVVVRSDAQGGALLVDAGRVDESKVQKLAETDEMAPGQSRTAQATLEAGRYILLCNVIGHYQAGMHTTFTVR